jgi:hypothetical protein
MNESEARMTHQGLIHDPGELVVVAGIHLADNLRREPCASKTTSELRILSNSDAMQAGHDGLPPLNAVGWSMLRTIRRDELAFV